MRKFVNGIKEHEWDKFCQDWIERRDGKKYDKESNYGSPICEYGKHYEFFERYNSSTIHLRAENNDRLYEIRLLCADRRGKFPIVALVYVDEFDYLIEFNCNGNSKDGGWKLQYESCFFDPGDYVVTTQGAIGIFANGWYMFACIEKNGTEHLKLCGCGLYTRLANADEITLLNEMLWANDKKWNNETKQLENVQN